MKNLKNFTEFVTEMYEGPADGAKSTAEFRKKQTELGYYPDAVSAEVGGPGNPGAVGEEEGGPTMLSKRLGDIEPSAEAYPSSAGQNFNIQQPGSKHMSSDNMRGEPKLVG